MSPQLLYVLKAPEGSCDLLRSPWPPQPPQMSLWPLWVPRAHKGPCGSTETPCVPTALKCPPSPTSLMSPQPHSLKLHPSIPTVPLDPHVSPHATLCCPHAGTLHRAPAAMMGFGTGTLFGAKDSFLGQPSTPLPTPLGAPAHGSKTRSGKEMFYVFLFIFKEKK